SGGGKWRRAYEEERDRHALLRTEHGTLRSDHDARTAASNARILDLERHEPAVGSGTAAAVAGGASGRRDDLTLIRGIDRSEETRLNDAGIHSYRDIAGLSADQESALEARLGYGRGRIVHEQWRDQADLLAHDRHEEHRGRFG
ncbi:MAG: hypothetical protein JWM75_845, partial [Sphingomonas bacterium]|nr:hypothetical protein [Sphingomonas bacterium]